MWIDKDGVDCQQISLTHYQHEQSKNLWKNGSRDSLSEYTASRMCTAFCEELDFRQ